MGKSPAKVFLSTAHKHLGVAGTHLKKAAHHIGKEAWKEGKKVGREVIKEGKKELKKEIRASVGEGREIMRGHKEQAIAKAQTKRSEIKAKVADRVNRYRAD